MPAKTDATEKADSEKKTTKASGPGEGLMRPGWIVAVGLYLVVLSILVLYGLLKVWPYPTPSGEPKPNVESQAGTSTEPATPNPTPAEDRTSSAPQPSPTRKLPDPEDITFFGGRFTARIYLETRLLLLVMLAGALGSLMHALRSLYWYTGNREMVWSWVAFYLLLPFTGAMLAVIFYLVVRGGFFSPQASTENTSPFGFAALSALVGLFSPQATLKLKEVAETIFTKPAAGADAKAQESDDEEVEEEEEENEEEGGDAGAGKTGKDEDEG